MGALAILQALTGCSGEEGANGSSTTSGATAPAAGPAPPPPSADAKLVFAFGDSLYAGYQVDPGESFPAELEKALRARGIAARVHNAGVSGDTSAAGLRRLAFALDGLPRTPDLALVNLGGNDMLRGIDPEETRRNLTAILAELKRRGIPVFITGMVAAPNLGRDYAARFNPIYPDLARQFDAGLDPFFLEGVITDRRLMQDDRIHPTAEGIDKIAARIAPQVAERLAD